MAIKASNKHVVEMDKQMSLAATGSDKPYLAMVVAAGFAAIDGAITINDRDAFKARLIAARPSATHKTLLDVKQSQIWSCVKLAFEYPHCATAIFQTIDKVKPTPTGLYDIACSIRSKAMFAPKAECEKKAIGLHPTSAVAPTDKAMLDSIKAANAYRNDLSGASNARPLDKVVESYAKMLAAFQSGKRDPKTGKPAKDAKGNAVTLPVIESKLLGEIIAKLGEFKVELATPTNGKVAQIAAARAKRAAKKAA